MKKEEKVELVNKLLNQFNSSLDNDMAKNAVLHAYFTINKPEKDSTKAKEIPDALEELDRDLIAISRQHYHFSDESMKIYRQIMELSRTKFGHGWGGLIATKLW